MKVTFSGSVSTRYTPAAACKLSLSQMRFQDTRLPGRARGGPDMATAKSGGGTVALALAVLGYTPSSAEAEEICA